ncbi:T9SS type A sorting domain-containing protein [Lewinella sp. LCG006]|uniref:T9SS type A sorting domain-containing protein n=1 Tax=Lewinella sp. LCG006 TaxID=3231911 RepID=UPI00345F5E2B
MRFPFILMICLLLMAVSTVAAQSTWENTFSKPDHDFRDYSITTAVDGSGDVVIAGTLHNKLTDERHIHVLRLNDKDGSVIFEFVYTATGNSWAKSITAFQDGSNTGYAITGYVDDGGVNRTVVLMLDENGVVTQTKVLEQLSATTNGMGLHIAATPDAFNDGFVIVGMVHEPLNGGDLRGPDKQSFCVKLDQNLGVVWEKYFDSNVGPLYTLDWDVANFVTPTDQGYFITGGKNGLTVIGQQRQGILALMLDGAGNQLWDASYYTGNSIDMGASAWYDQSNQKVYVLANISVSHHLGISVFDALTGALDASQSFEASSSNFELDKYGHTLVKSPYADHLTIQGRALDYSWSGGTNQGQIGFLVNYNLSAQSFGVHYLEPNNSAALNSISTFDPLIPEAISAWYYPQALVNLDALSGAMLSYWGGAGDDAGLLVRKFRHSSPDNYEFCEEGNSILLDVVNPVLGDPGVNLTESNPSAITASPGFADAPEATFLATNCQEMPPLPSMKTFDVTYQLEPDTLLNTMDLGVEVVQASNGNYFTIGHSVINGELEMVVARYGVDGTVLGPPQIWIHPSSTFLEVVEVEELRDAAGITTGLLVLLYEDNTGSDKMHLAKLDATGLLLWIKELSLGDPAVSEVQPYDFVLHGDLAVITGAATVGSTTKTFITTYDHVAMLSGCANVLDINPGSGAAHSGRVVVNREDELHYGIAGLLNNDLIYLEVEYDCSYFASNLALSYWVDNNNTTKDIPVEIIYQQSPLVLAIVGYQESSNRFFIQLGQLVSFYQYSGAEVVVNDAVVNPLNNSTVVVAGNLRANGNSTAFLAGIDLFDLISSNNGLQWSQTYNDAEYPESQVYDITPTADGGYAFTGGSIQKDRPSTGFGRLNYFDTWLVKTDGQGGLGNCDCSAPIAWNFSSGGGTGAPTVFNGLTSLAAVAATTTQHGLHDAEYVCDRYCPMPDPEPFCTEDNLIQNGNFEQGTPTPSDEDITNASFWGPIWQPTAGFSTADFYNTSQLLPSGLATPLPASQGNFGGMWSAYVGGQVFREGMMNELVNTILPNTGQYELSFKVACLGGYFTNPELSIWGVNAPGLATGASPVSFSMPTNDGFFGGANSFEFATYPFPSNCDEQFVTLTFVLNSADPGFPAAGINHLFFTRKDGMAGGVYIALDDVCLRPLQCCESETAFTNAMNDFTINVNGATTTVSNPSLADCDELSIAWGDGQVELINANLLPISHVYTGSGQYNICIDVMEVADDGTVCFSDQYCNMISETSLVQSTNEVKVFPNPTDGLTTVKWEEAGGFTQVSIMDVNGRVLIQEALDPSDYVMQIDMSRLSSGVYLLLLSTNTGELVSKRIVRQ